MATITFQPVLRTIKEVLAAEFLDIPRFQRPYSWSIENLQDFLRDVVTDNDEGYFIGPMVGFDLEHGTVGLVDGQQRVTSITLMLCALRDLFSEVGATDSLTGISKYIERGDDDSVSHFVLKSAAVGPFLHAQFQANPPRASQTAHNEEQRALVKAFDQIRKSLDEEISGLPRDGGTPDKPSPALLRLREIRDRVLALKVIWIRLDSEDDAYVIFETLNSRGKDLEVVDLLKNLVLREVRAENGDLDSTRLKWTEMRTELEENGAGVNPNKYILHWWLSREDYTAERKLFRAIRKTVTAKNAAETVELLRNDSLYYARIVNPAKWQISPYEREVRDSLAALNTFGVSQPRPMLLALLRAYYAGQIKYARLRKTLNAIENFHYVTTAIVGVSSTGGVSEMYAKHARELTSAKSQDARNSSLDALIGKLKDPARLPSRDAFLSEFPRALRFSEQETGAKRLVQYSLRKLHDQASPNQPFDHSKCNIEHLSPQQDGEAWMPAIGNLLWIHSGLNGDLGTKSFAQKQALLRHHATIYNIEDVLGAAEWGQSEVDARSKRLAELAYDTVWRTA